MKFIIALAVLCSAALLQGKAINKREAEKEPCPEDCKSKPLEISFVVDASASIWPQNFTIGLWFVQNFVDKFNIGPDEVRVSMVTYGERVYEEDAFNFEDHTNKDELDELIENIPYRHGRATATGAGINYMLDHQQPHAREGVKKVVIVLTDGNSQDARATKAAAERALEAGLEVFAIGVGHDVGEDELHTIASDDEHVFIVDSYNLLDSIIDRLAFEACGGEPEPEKTCHYDPTDIVFVIDSSVSIGEGNFTEGLTFIQEFLKPFEISESAVRVAAIMYGRGVYEESAIEFDEYSNKKDILDAISELEWMHGTRTDTGKGIDYMLDHFLPHYRPNAAHIAIVITDGASQDVWHTQESAEKARATGIVMYAVGIGKVGPGGNLKESELTNIAGDKERVLVAEDYARLNLILADLLHITCHGITRFLEARAAAA